MSLIFKDFDGNKHTVVPCSHKIETRQGQSNKVYIDTLGRRELIGYKIHNLYGPSVRVDLCYRNGQPILSSIVSEQTSTNNPLQDTLTLDDELMVKVINDGEDLSIIRVELFVGGYKMDGVERAIERCNQNSDKQK